MNIIISIITTWTICINNTLWNSRISIPNLPSWVIRGTLSNTRIRLLIKECITWTRRYTCQSFSVPHKRWRTINSANTIRIICIIKLWIRRTFENTFHCCIISIIFDWWKRASWLTRPTVLRVSIITRSNALSVTLALIWKGSIIIQTTRTQIDTYSCNVVLKTSSFTHWLTNISCILTPQVFSYRTSLNTRCACIVCIPMVSINCWTIKRIFNTCSFYSFTPCISITSLDAISLW